jgi:hypothetical protein
VGLRRAITNGLAATHGTPIKHVPPPIDCVVNPIPCFRSIPTKIHKIVEAMNRHGLDDSTIPLGQIPASYRTVIPPALKIVGAATNAGDPAAVKRRGYIFSLVFDRVAADSLRQRFVKILGRNWGVFVDENSVTLFHPFYLARPPDFSHFRNRPRALRRASRRYRSQARRDIKLDRVGYAVLRGLDRLMTTR